MNDMQEKNDAAKRPPSRRAERWLFIGGGVMVFMAAASFVIRAMLLSGAGDGLTRQTLPELTEADHIAAEPGSLEGFNVLIISMDTTRADHIGCYGNRSVQTPVIDNLARQGILMADAVTPSPSTLPAHSSLLTGLYPATHGARANGTFRLEDKITTLAERLKAQGYNTGAVISAFVLDGRFGLKQGFDMYDDDLTKGMKWSSHMFRERAAELTNEPATAWLKENADGPFFLWVHYFDPHAVYMPPEPFATQYATDLYDGEIAYTDAQIATLLKTLEDLGVRDKTLIVLTSDHGEGLGEHGEQTHSLLIYDATLHVPMIFNAPSKLPKGQVIERQACLVDVVPTVLSLLGQPVPDELDGRDLTQPPPDGPRPVLIETIATMTLHGWAPLVGVRREDYKYIVAPTPELYDLRSDPRELKNIHDDDPDKVAELTERLAQWLGEDPFLAASKAIELSNLNMDPETMQKLGSLGYIMTASPGDEAPMHDPKDMIEHWETVHEGIHLRAAGKPKEAVVILEQCLAEVEGDVFARMVLASSYQQLGESEQALQHYKIAAELDPNDESVYLAMAGVHLSERRIEQAEAQIARALELEPEAAQAFVLRGRIEQLRRKPKAAIELFEKAIEMDPGSTGPGAYNHIGFLNARLGRFEQAREAFNAAIEIDGLNGAAHAGLADILIAEGKDDEAITRLVTALRFDPNHPRALATLAPLLSRRGEHARGEQLCRRALEMAPKFAPAHNNLGLICRRQDKLDEAEHHYLQAIEYDPRDGLAHVNLAQLYTRQGKADEALEHFQLAVKANPMRPHEIALANLAAHHAGLGEYKKAHACYVRALKTAPAYPVAHRNIALLYTLEQWDRPDLAAYHLIRSLDLDPEQADADKMKLLLDETRKRAAERNLPIPEMPKPDQVKPEIEELPEEESLPTELLPDPVDDSE